MPMNLTPEEFDALYTKEVPDVQICFHEVRIQPVKVDIDGGGGYGYIARMVGHGADGKPMTIDFVTTEPVLQETMSRFIEAGMISALNVAMDAATNGGDSSALLSILSILPDETTENRS